MVRERRGSQVDSGNERAVAAHLSSKRKSERQTAKNKLVNRTATKLPDHNVSISFCFVARFEHGYLN